MLMGVLGTTRVWRDDGSEVAVGGPAARALLALLLVRSGEAVTADRLVDDLYGARARPGRRSRAAALRICRTPLP